VRYRQGRAKTGRVDRILLGQEGLGREEENTNILEQAGAERNRQE
jgi:hypothetical protein